MSLKNRIKNLEKLQEPDEALEALKACFLRYPPYKVPDEVVDLASALAHLDPEALWLADNPDWKQPWEEA